MDQMLTTVAWFVNGEEIAKIYLLKMVLLHLGLVWVVRE